MSKSKEVTKVTNLGTLDDLERAQAIPYRTEIYWLPMRPVTDTDLYAVRYELDYAIDRVIGSRRTRWTIPLEQMQEAIMPYCIAPNADDDTDEDQLHTGTLVYTDAQPESRLLGPDDMRLMDDMRLLLVRSPATAIDPAQLPAYASKYGNKLDWDTMHILTYLNVPLLAELIALSTAAYGTRYGMPIRAAEAYE